MDDNILVYVAGNPSAYPLEYYDPSSGTYQGVIPRLLAQFSAQSPYELVYYSPGEEDQREQLGKNLQVDLLSGYIGDEELPSEYESIPLFQVTLQGKEVSYCLCATQVASDQLKTDLQGFLSTVSQQAITGLVVESTSSAASSGFFPLATAGLALTAVLLTTAMLLVIRHFRKRLRRLHQELEGDEATGLRNFDYLLRYYKQIINDQNRILYSLLYFYVDTDHLHRLTSGLETSEFLRYCALVLQEHTTDTDILAKVTDNGFALLKLSGSPEQLKPWITGVLHKLRSYPQTYSKPFDVRIAVGIYPLKMGDRDLNEMLFNASQEAQTALRGQTDCSVFSDESLKRIQMEQNLRATVDKAMESREFQLYIQFYVDARTHQVVGGEALSRWLHPEHGLLSPNVFVPVLEREGLIYKLDFHCLRSSCQFLQELFDRGIQNFFLSCNFSRETFSAADFAEQCRKIIDDYCFPRELLIFELTESVSCKNLSSIRSNMTALKKYGVRIALDDFGEGFTSFSDLQEYPVDGVKLDKGLIDNVLTTTGNSILRAMVQVGHELGLTILAEGVETQAQAQALQAIHCDVIQGFQFFAPLPASEVKDKLLQER